MQHKATARIPALTDNITVPPPTQGHPLQAWARRTTTDSLPEAATYALQGGLQAHSEHLCA